MHANKAYSNTPNTASLRNQLLSSDVGSIDVRHETPINRSSFQQQQQQQQQQQPQQPQQPQHQQHQQQYGAQPFQQPPPNQGQFYPQQHAPYQPHNGSYQPPHVQQQPQQYNNPRSRRSSIVSNHSTFNIMKFGKKKKQSMFGGGDDDDDEDGKDVVMDPTTVSTMSFDDLSSMRDRGRYGLQQQNFDTAPIIPTLQTPGTRPGSGVSNVQYRKQMTAMKKQVYSQAGKMTRASADPRAMSLQTPMGINPYAGPDSRSNSLAGQQQQNPQFIQGPVPSRPGPGPRANSLSQFAPNNNQGPRAYSLTTNPYQQQQQQYMQQQRMAGNGMGPGPALRGPPGPQRQQQQQQQQQQRQPPHPQQGHIPQPMNGHRLSAPNVSSPLSGSTQPLAPSQQGPPPQNGQQHMAYAQPQAQRQAYSGPPPSHDAPQQQYSTHNDQQAHAQPPFTNQLTLEKSLNPHIEEEEREASHSSLDPRSNSNYSNGLDNSGDHHFLAEKTITAQNHTSLSFNDTSLPNGESTPSPENQRTQVTSSTRANEVSPSKLPRIKALPRLSVLSIRDDDDDEDEDGIQEYEHPGRESPKQRVLEPVNEDSVANPYPRSTTPAGMSYFQSPERSPAKRPMSSRVSPHKNHNKNAISISSMSEYSTVSDAPPPNADSTNKLYQLAQASNTNNDVFVTASQFSFMNEEKRSSVVSNVTDTDVTLKNNRRSVDETSIKSSSSIKGFFKSLPLQKRKEKKDQYHGDVFEHVVKPVPVKAEEVRELPPKEPELLSDSTNESSVESKPTTLAESFVPQIQQKTRLGLTVDQLGIMEEKSSIMRELDIVSRELAISIRREISLEEKFGTPTEREHLAKSLDTVQVLQQLNEERKKRYIAEEHVLLLESGSKPSALELSYEIDRLKSDLAFKDELINKQASEIESLKTEVPQLQDKLQTLYQKNRTLESQVVPKLQNEIEMLHVENKNVSILRERLKIMKNEKEQLDSGNFSFVNDDIEPVRSMVPSSSSKKLSSFNLISVASSE